MSERERKPQGSCDAFLFFYYSFWPALEWRVFVIILSDLSPPSFCSPVSLLSCYRQSLQSELRSWLIINSASDLYFYKNAVNQLLIIIYILNLMLLPKFNLVQARWQLDMNRRPFPDVFNRGLIVRSYDNFSSIQKCFINISLVDSGTHAKSGQRTVTKLGEKRKFS